MFVNTHYRAFCLLSRQIGWVVKSWAGCLLHANNVRKFRCMLPLGVGHGALDQRMEAWILYPIWSWSFWVLEHILYFLKMALPASPLSAFHLLSNLILEWCVAISTYYCNFGLEFGITKKAVVMFNLSYIIHVRVLIHYLTEISVIRCTLTYTYISMLMYGIAYYEMRKKNIRELMFQLATKSPMMTVWKATVKLQ
jgi:hypothetical protein